MSKRLFLTLELTDGQKDALVCIQQISAGGQVKWVEKEQYHITVAFLGDVDQQWLSALKEAVERVVKMHRPFTLISAGYQYVPLKNGSPRMIWMSFAQAPEFTALARDMKHELKRFSEALVIDTREPIPHITLARMQGSAGKLADLPAMPPFIVNVSSVLLMESVLSNKGPHYTLLNRFSLC